MESGLIVAIVGHFRDYTSDMNASRALDERFSSRRALAITVGLSTAGWILVGGIVVAVLQLI